MTIRTGSESLYVYLQHPANGQWQTVGRYRLEPGAGLGWFAYAPSYLASTSPLSIDPINLPLSAGTQEQVAVRYRGLHDVLRDACPDAWGQTVLAREYGLSEDAHPSRFLLLSDNDDRWGALAIGVGRSPPAAALSHPKLAQLGAVVSELRAMCERRPAVNASLRKRLTHRSSLGGARPKATVVDGHADFWLVKPGLQTDTADIPCLEFFALHWARMCGLSVADAVLHQADGSIRSMDLAPGALPEWPRTGDSGISAVRIRRFDRQGPQRFMTLSAASLLQMEYPGAHAAGSRRSYPALAETLTRIGAPVTDRIEMFRRMVFNIVCGNDDDHLRNHAVVYSATDRCWRLSPAYDVVPNPDYLPQALHLAPSVTVSGTSRKSILADAVRFGFSGIPEAEQCLDDLLDCLEARFEAASDCLSAPWRHEMSTRLQDRLVLLRAGLQQK